MWNAQPENVAMATSTDGFKRRLESWRIGRSVTANYADENEPPHSEAINL